MTQNMPQNNPNALPQPEHRFDHQAEDTLRLLATLPPPAGLEDRVHLRVDARIRTAEYAPTPRSIWSLWMPSRRLQFAGAAILVMALAGSTWSAYHTKSGQAVIQPVTQPASPTTPANSFGTAGAEGRPSTLTPIKVLPAPKKKPASGTAKKPSPKKLANSSRTATQPAQ